jgi:hypothetical protein
MLAPTKCTYTTKGKPQCMPTHTNTCTHNNLELKHLYFYHTLWTLKDNPQAMTTKVSHAIAVRASCARNKPSYRVRSKYARIWPTCGLHHNRKSFAC